jgi:hypothetical protein
MKSPGAAATARDAAHKECLMDEIIVTPSASPSGRPAGGDGKSAEVHHAAPRCLLTLHERANGAALDGEGIQAWVEWEMEAMRWRVPVEIARSDLEVLVAASGVVLEREKHRLLHSTDWRRWGSRGGKETLRRYGPTWFVLLALRRWERITAAELEAARVPR